MLSKFVMSLNSIGFNGKNIYAINNINIDIARNLKLTIINKNQKFISQIRKKPN